MYTASHDNNHRESLVRAYSREPTFDPPPREQHVDAASLDFDPVNLLQPPANDSMWRVKSRKIQKRYREPQTVGWLLVPPAWHMGSRVLVSEGH